MPSTPTTSLRLEKIAYNEQSETWGTSLDQVLDKLDASEAGYKIISINGLATYSLVATNFTPDEAANKTIAFTGTLTQACQIIVPSVSKYTVYINATSGGFAVNIQTSSGSAYSLPAGFQAALVCDGLNHIDACTYIAGSLQVVGSISANQFTAIGGALSVSGGGTGATTQAGAFANLTPPGVMVMFGGDTIPTGWSECDGGLLNRSANAGLFGTIGIKFGAGDGSSTFAKPDFRGRVPVGAGTGGGLSSRVVGNSGGEETHALVAAELTPHTHSGVTLSNNFDHTHSGTTGTDSVDHSHTYFASQSGPFAVGSGGGPGTTGDGPAGTTTGVNTFHTHSFTTGGASGSHQHGFTTDTGTGLAGIGHNVMQPFTVVRVIIKL